MDRRIEGRPIRVLLADDHTMFRQGLAVLLSGYGGMEVVGQTGNDEGAVQLARRTRPDVVLMQAETPLEKARENLVRIRSINPAPKVIVLTTIEDPRYVRRLLGMGASAYVLKSTSADHLIAAVRAAISDPESEPNVVVGLPKVMLEETYEGTSGALSVRQLEILLLAARGLSNRQIAACLHLAETTVKRHLANIYAKMGVGSRSEATKMALNKRWITIQEITEKDGPPSDRG